MNKIALQAVNPDSAPGIKYYSLSPSRNIQWIKKKETEMIPEHKGVYSRQAFKSS